MFRPTIKFTAEYSKQEVNFLDLNIKLITKPSSAAVRTRRRLGNTSTCPYVRFDI